MAWLAGIGSAAALFLGLVLGLGKKKNGELGKGGGGVPSPGSVALVESSGEGTARGQCGTGRRQEVEAAWHGMADMLRETLGQVVSSCWSFCSKFIHVPPN